jgi:hypothetical protein
MNALSLGNAAKRVSLRLFLVVVIAGIFSFLPVPVSAEDPPPSANAVSGAAQAQASFSRLESVLERFRSYKGEKNRITLGNLFRRSDAGFTQDPAVLLSNGTAQARVTVRVSAQGDQAPSFMVSGGKCVGVEITDNNTWLFDIVPDRGSSATSVTILTEKSMVEYPLTVAPPLSLFDTKKAESALVEYVETANELASGQTASGRK